VSPGRILLLGVLLVLVAGPAHAHPGGSHGYAALTIEGGSAAYTLTLWPATLPPAVAEEVQRARAGDATSRDRLLAVIRDKVAVTIAGRRCRPGPGSSTPPVAGVESLTLTVEYACDGGGNDVVLRDDLVDAFGADYHTLARIDASGRSVPFVFGAEAREARAAGDAPPVAARGFAGFLLLGVEHILLGWDHLLFLLVLLLGGGGWLAVIKIITAFTVAHSATLALAALDVVALPSRLVEAVIALSIACVAAENVFWRPATSRRWIVSFGFGLVHGFGFSSVLREIGLPPQGLLLSLLGFNLGVEAGQALVVAVVLPGLMFVRRTRWERPVIWSSSSAILLVGVVLFVERAFL
jgi:hypothetical protein